MNIVKSYNPNKWFFKTKYMAGDRFEDSIHEWLSDLKNCKIEIVHHFENKATFALNHWIGILKITQEDNSYNQYVISAVAGKEDALEKIYKQACKDLEYYELNFENNLVQEEIKCLLSLDDSL